MRLLGGGIVGYSGAMDVREYMDESVPDEVAADLKAVARVLHRNKRTIALAESCTGGLLSKMLTDLPGSSAYFTEGIVAYSNSAKQRLLGVNAALIEAHGAVSREVAAAMAEGCRQRSAADYAVSTTGIAGPRGGTAAKPVGLVYVGVADAAGHEVFELRLDPELSRGAIRMQTAAAALRALRGRIEPPAEAAKQAG